MTYYYHSVVDSPHLPRALTTDSAQSAVVTLLGEFWSQSNAPEIPSAAIVEVLRRVGITEAAVRAALSRLTKKGTLDSYRHGRTTSYLLSDEVRASIPASELLTMTFGLHERSWDGNWTVVIYSLPEAQREQRDQLREWLRWLGFGNVRDGVWLSPHASVDLVLRGLVGVLPDNSLVFSSHEFAGTVAAESVWPLADVRVAYESFIEDFRPTVYDLRAGSVPGPEALRLALRLIGRWRGFPTIDPDLPREALSEDWPRAEARRVFATVYDAALPIAATWLGRVLEPFDADAAAAVRVLSTAEALAEFQRTAPRESPSLDLQSFAPAKLRQNDIAA